MVVQVISDNDSVSCTGLQAWASSLVKSANEELAALFLSKFDRVVEPEARAIIAHIGQFGLGPQQAHGVWSTMIGHKAEGTALTLECFVRAVASCARTK